MSLLKQASKRKRQNRDSENGQATVEFALTLILIMGFVLFYMQLSLVFAWGNYAHYATFMSARAYLASGPDRSDQERRAKNVMVRMVKRGQASPNTDRFPNIAKGEGAGDLRGVQIQAPSFWQDGERTKSWAEGVRYTFRSRIFLLPMGRPEASNPNANTLTLTSESWLGREPSSSDCQDEMKKMKGIIDNGC